MTDQAHCSSFSVACIARRFTSRHRNGSGALLSAAPLATCTTRKSPVVGTQSSFRIRKDRLSYGDRGVPVSKVFPRLLAEFGSHDLKRSVSLAQGDEVAIEESIVMPVFHKPVAVRDIRFSYCDHRLKGSAAFSELSPPFRRNRIDRFSKSEKGVDLELVLMLFSWAVPPELKGFS